MTISEQTGHKKQKVLFEEMDFAGCDKVIILNKPKLLEVIDAACNQTSLASLREKIFTLREHLSTFKADKEGLLNIGTNGDTVPINQKYLFGELKQIVETQTLERSKYYLHRLAKAIAEQKTNKINDLNLNRWKEHEDIITDSLWVLDKRDNSGVHKADYWGNFIPQIPNQMMKRYTKRGEWVLDTFAGCGTTLIEAQRLGRNCIGVELQPQVVKTANELIRSEPNRFKIVSEVVEADSCSIDYEKLLQGHGQKSVQLLIMHPPYFDIIKFSNDHRDLSNAKSVDDFLVMMNSIVRKASAVLDEGRYFALVIGDKYSKGEWMPLGFLTMQEVLKCGFILKSIIVKNFEETFGKRNQKYLWRYRALVGGFYIFKHEYIFLFKKK
jgi:16S rRNA G966 N2-methylase RsmD